jgi:hypothetical protein
MTERLPDRGLAAGDRPLAAGGANPLWAELVQLVPSIVLAFPFIVGGAVDLSRAGPQFVAAAAAAVPIQAFVLARGHLLNPILVGASLWLAAGAVAFGVPVASAAAWFAETQAFGLFGSALGVGLATTATSSTGYVATRHPDAQWVRRASWVLLGVTAIIVGWSWAFRHDVRLGGGLPFIVLNVTRRVLILRAPRS